MKIAYDFERYGRYAWDISSTHKRLTDSGKCVHSFDIMEKIAKKTLEMVHTSEVALRDNDAELAKTLVKTENEVDEMYSPFLDQMSKGSPTTKYSVQPFGSPGFLKGSHTTPPTWANRSSTSPRERKSV